MTSAPELATLEPTWIADLALASEGARVIEWTRLNMPLLRGDEVVAREALGTLSSVELH